MWPCRIRVPALYLSGYSAWRQPFFQPEPGALLNPLI